jgi:hypothetical protein
MAGGAPDGSFPFEGQILCAEQKNTEILILDATLDWSRPEAVLWRWAPLQADGLPPERAGWFVNCSDCKCVMDGTHVLVSASGGAVALVRVTDRKTVFLAYAGGNTHSAELLPDGNVASVSSTGGYIRIFVREGEGPDPGRVRSVTVPYPDAHGVVWDGAQRLLWVLGHDLLTSFRYDFRKDAPGLEKVREFRPSEEVFVGHDLFPMPHTRSLYLSGRAGVLAFDTVTHGFRTALDRGDVKSVSAHPSGGKILLQVPNEQWWNDSIEASDGRRMRLPGARFYKARWFVANPFSYGNRKG